MSKTIGLMILLLLTACASSADVHVDLAPVHATLDTTAAR